MLAIPQPQDFLETALSAVRNGDGWQSILSELPVPVYTTDAQGVLTYWNQACVEMTGREPQLGQDQWCVTWQLYTVSGEPLPHDQCPMARAIKEKRAIHDEIIIAERPDGHRVACRPYPTPFFDADGNLDGAVNLIVDVTNEQAGALVAQASRCKRLARSTSDARAAEILSSMAKGYAATAAALREG
jgi:PAS domain S-box-containing protein